MQPVRVRQRPGRERVGGEPGVHQRQLADEPLVGQVGEERLELAGRQHALVDQGPGRQRREVDAGLALGPLAQAERHPLQAPCPKAPPPARADEQLAEARHDARGRCAEQRRGRPARRASRGRCRPSSAAMRLDRRPRGCLRGVVVRQEGDADGVRALVGQRERRDAAQERVRDLGQDAGAVTGVRLGAGRTAVVEVAQRGQRLVDDLVARRRRTGSRRRRHRRRRARSPGRRGPARAVRCRTGERAQRAVPSSSMAPTWRSVPSSTEGRHWPCGTAASITVAAAGNA